MARLLDMRPRHLGGLIVDTEPGVGGRGRSPRCAYGRFKVNRVHLATADTYVVQALSHIE